MASRAGLVRANDHIVVVQMLAGAFVVKIVSVDEQGHGIQAIRPKSLVDLMMARPVARTLLKGMCFRGQVCEVEGRIQARPSGQVLRGPHAELAVFARELLTAGWPI